MQGQRGFTLVEMTVSVAILALMSSMAVLAGVGFVTSSRISRVANQFADQAALARERSIARYEQWRIRFNTPPGGAAIRSYVVESCQLPVGTPGSICPGPWVVQTTIQLENGTGLIVVNKANAPETDLIFDRSGQFLTATTEITICGTVTSGGADTCRPKSTKRLVRIRSFSGIIETRIPTQ
jgi:prepilin-type N-terminal cleavage/methylation domain-containing protein